MKLELNKKWFADRIPDDDHDVEAGVPAELEPQECPQEVAGTVDEFVETYAFGALVRLLRRQRRLSLPELATDARVAASELVSIEVDPKYVPNPRTVYQLASYFEIPERSLLKLANVTSVHSDKLRDAAVRFAANSSQVMELTREERAALAEFVAFLSSQEAD